MKFKIRFADQIVGFFIIVCLLSLVFVTVMLGRSQRWFARDVSFYTVLYTAGGLSRNMNIQYRGFTIGNVRDFQLVGETVEVVFTIFEEYRDRVRQGSMVEVAVSPIGLGSQFLFHTGRGAELPEGAFIPIMGSAQAMELVRLGLAVEPQQVDSISVIMNRVDSVLEEVQGILANMNEAFGEGSDATEIGMIASSLRRTLTGVETLPHAVEETISALAMTIDGISAELSPILGNISALTAELADPDGFVFTVLDAEGEVYAYLVESLGHISSMLENLERATAFIPAQLPQVAGLIMDLRVTMQSAEEVLVALTNNPLLRRGVPGRLESESAGTSPRNIRF